MTSRGKPIRASKAANRSSMAAGSPMSSPAPQAWAVSRQNPIRRSSIPASRMASAMRPSSSTLVPRPPPLPAEFSRTSIVSSASGNSARSNASRTPSVSRAMPAVTPWPVCEPTWTLTNRAPNDEAPRSSSAMSVDGARVRDGIRTRQVHQVRRVDGEGADVRGGQTGPERRQLGRWRGATLPGTGVVGEDLHRARADLHRAVDGLDHAAGEGHVGADPSAVGKHRSIVRCGPSGADAVRSVPRLGPGLPVEAAAGVPRRRMALPLLRQVPAPQVCLPSALPELRPLARP